MIKEVVTRRADLHDLDVVLDDVAAGFASYISFAPAGWQPPDVRASRDGIAQLLDDEDTWALVALVGNVPLGHVAFMPARERGAGDTGDAWKARPVIAGLAHLWQLFVLPDWWGHGVAPLLHDAAIEEMRARDYRTARLFTPTEHVRARRFYERRGWGACEDRFNDELGLMLTEYQRPLEPYAL